jgi:hypothetical protein
VGVFACEIAALAVRIFVSDQSSEAADTHRTRGLQDLLGGTDGGQRPRAPLLVDLHNQQRV